jgi:hypothetical protein
MAYRVETVKEVEVGLLIGRIKRPCLAMRGQPVTGSLTVA